MWPTEGRIVSSFDPTRKGIDIAGQAGQPIVAASDGTVLYARNMRGYGNLVIVDHNDGLVSAYAHNKTILVKSQTSAYQNGLYRVASQVGSGTIGAVGCLTLKLPKSILSLYLVTTGLCTLTPSLVK